MLHEIRHESAAYSQVTPDEDYVEANFLNMLKTPGVVFLIDDSGQGMIVGYCLSRWNFPDLLAVEDTFYVSKARRGSTIGYRLLRKFEQVCTDLGATQITLGLTTGINVERTTKFYNAFGYEQSGTKFTKRIS